MHSLAVRLKENLNHAIPSSLHTLCSRTVALLSSCGTQVASVEPGISRSPRFWTFSVGRSWEVREKAERHESRKVTDSFQEQETIAYFSVNYNYVLLSTVLSMLIMCSFLFDKL